MLAVHVPGPSELFQQGREDDRERVAGPVAKGVGRRPHQGDVPAVKYPLLLPARDKGVPTGFIQDLPPQRNPFRTGSLTSLFSKTAACGKTDENDTVVRNALFKQPAIGSDRVLESSRERMFRRQAVVDDQDMAARGS